MFTAQELSGMRATQDAYMMDTGNFQPVSIAVNSYNENVESYPTNSADIQCGLEMKSGAEKNAIDYNVVVYDGIIRLPINTTFDIRDRFRVTKRHGEAITPLVYKIVSPAQRGSSGIRILVQLVK